MVTSRGKGQIEDHFDFSYELEGILEERGKTQELEVVRNIGRMVRTISVRQKKPLGLGHAILCAKDVVGDEPFLVLLPDDIISAEPTASRQMLDVYEKYGEGVVSVMEVPREEVSRYGIMDGEQWGEGLWRVRMLVEKPAQDLAPSNLAVIGRYVLPSIIFKYLEDVRSDQSGEIQLTDALARLSRERALIGASFHGVRHDIGDRLGLITANVSFALERPELRDGVLEFLKKTCASLT